MDTYRFTQYGSLDYLARGQEPLPEPGPGQVRVQVMASSLNFRDLLVMKGTLRYPTTPGAVPLSDAAGIIDALGPGVQRFKLGDRVINSFSRTGSVAQPTQAGNNMVLSMTAG